MTIGNALFGRIAIRDFGRLQGEIADLQARVSSGKNDPRPSTDLMRAAQLSAMREQTGAVERFTDNAHLAADRLAHADLALGEIATLGRQFHQIALQAANDTTTPQGKAGLKAQALALRQALLAAANRTDTMGQPLFAGLSGRTPFVDGAGGVVFQGDGGRPVLRMTASLLLETGLNGGALFQSIPTEAGTGDMFRMVDDLIATLTPPLSAASPFREVQNRALLVPAAGRDGQALAFTLTGPKGTARIAAEVARGAPEALVAAINAQALTTGVTAEVAPNGEGAMLCAPNASFRLADFATGGDERAPVARLVPLGAEGTARDAIDLRAAQLASDRMVGLFSDALDHLSAQRAEAGALADLAEKTIDTLANRKLRLQEAVAGLEDLDVAAALTRLQTLLLTEQAAQQSFVKINGTSLFDYLR